MISAEDRSLADAIETVITICKEAMAADNKLAFLLAHIVELIDAIKVIVDFILDQLKGDKVMATQYAHEFLRLEGVLSSCIEDAPRPEGPLTWLAVLRLILKLLEMLRKDE